jgi:hypothetical protein
MKLYRRKQEIISTKNREDSIKINNKMYIVVKLDRNSALHLQKLSCANLSRIVGSCIISIFIITQVSFHFPESIEALPMQQHIYYAQAQQHRAK